MRHRPSAPLVEAVEALLREGFLVNNTSPRTVCMLPLVIDVEDLDALVAALRRYFPGL